MATHHGKEGVVKTGSNVTGEVTAFTLETTGDVVEDTSLSDSAKTFVAGRTTKWSSSCYKSFSRIW